jgi:hypothetical protein
MQFMPLDARPAPPFAECAGGVDVEPLADDAGRPAAISGGSIVLTPRRISFRGPHTAGELTGRACILHQLRCRLD